jgi:hypothetical protein
MDDKHKQAMHHVAQAHALGTSTAEQRRAARVDVVGHSGVQPWSAGEIFPCVIARVERYSEEPSKAQAQAMRAAFGYADRDVLLARGDIAERLQSVSYELIAYGRREEYASREDAEMVARALNKSPNVRDGWKARGGGYVSRGYGMPGVHDQSGVAL